MCAFNNMTYNSLAAAGRWVRTEQELRLQALRVEPRPLTININIVYYHYD